MNEYQSDRGVATSMIARHQKPHHDLIVEKLMRD